MSRPKYQKNQKPLLQKVLDIKERCVNYHWLITEVHSLKMILNGTMCFGCGQKEKQIQRRRVSLYYLLATSCLGSLGGLVASVECEPAAHGQFS